MKIPLSYFLSGFRAMIRLIRLGTTALKLKFLYLLNNKPIIIVHDRKKFFFTNDGDKQEILYHTFWQEYYQEEFFIINNYIKPGWNVIDVGANLGFYSLLLLDLVGADGQIFSFEPSKYIFEKLKKNIDANKAQNIHLFNYGCGDREFKSVLYVDKEYSGMTSMNKEELKKIAEEEVSIVTIDGIFCEKNIKIDFIKIDTEGYEYSVLRGAYKLINKYKPIILVELGGGKFLNNSKETINLLANLGYNFPSLPDSFEKIGYGKNFVAVPKL